MSAWAPAVGERRDPTTERSLPFAPREGWSSVALLVVMLWTLGTAIDDANWAGFTAASAQQTAFLPTAGVLAVLIGFVLSKTRLPISAVYFIGCAIGAGFLLISAADVVSDAPTLLGRLQALNESIEIFYEDLVILGIRSNETSAFVLTIGTIVWATGLYGAVNLFRRGRAMPAVVATGIVLLINVCVTVRLQYLHLVLFSGAAMLLLVRMNLQSQQDGWARRRIGDTDQAAGLFLRGGVGFVILTLVGSIALAASASSAPLANAWRNMDDTLLDVGSEINRVIGGVTGQARGPSGLFGSTQTILGRWASSSEVVYRSRSSDLEAHYMRGAAYDRFDGISWYQTDGLKVGVAAGQELLATTSETASTLPGTRPVDITVTSVALAGERRCRRQRR